jgi:SAM-dependent methyltransferase
MPQPDEPIRYAQRLFDVSDREEARSIILQAPDPALCDWRWANETPWFGRLIVSACAVDSESRILDFGCGLGRLAKWLIDNVGCRVVGVDISPSMRELAVEYVDSDRFAVISYEEFCADPRVGEGFDGAFACYVLQHVERPDRDVPAIAAALRPGAGFLLVNSLLRWVPTTHGLARDDFDVFAITRASLVEERTFAFPAEVAVAPDLAAETRLILYRRP